MENREKKVKIAYAEPDDYFPKEIREQYKLGEFDKSENTESGKCLDDTKMSDFIKKNWAEYQRVQENLTSNESEKYLESCGGIPTEIAPRLDNDKDPTIPISRQQKTIHEK